LKIKQLCQNENVGRSYTSECFVQDIRRPDRRTPFKNLVSKTFNFVHEIWKCYVQLNSQDIRPIDYEHTQNEENMFDYVDVEDIEEDGVRFNDDDDYYYEED
jgi:hypothetical protein